MNRAAPQYIAAWLFIGTSLLKMLYIDFTIVTILWLVSTLLLAITWLSLDSLLLLLPYTLITTVAFIAPGFLPDSWPVTLRLAIIIGSWGTFLLVSNAIIFIILNKQNTAPNDSRQRSENN